MSKVAISGGATGSATYTIQAPTGSTDRVLTLPDEAGTVLTSGGAIADALNVDSAPTNSLEVDSSSNLKFNSGYGSVATAYGCRAWVNFNGTGTVAIRDSGNVSSITDNNTGDYTVNFSTALADANYAATVGSNLDNSTGGRGSLTGTFAYTTSSVRLFCVRCTTAGPEDPLFVSLSVHR